MSGSQMLLVMGGLILISFLGLNINRSITNAQLQTYNAEYIATATAIGQSVLNKVTTKAFDKNTVSNPVYSQGLFTPADSLAPSPGKQVSAYDNIDDFNNYTEVDSTPRSDNYTVRVTVNYVDDNNSATILSTTSRTKRIKVTVTNPMMGDTVYLYSYKSY
ncbi:MAG: hypothetical protein ACYDA4_06290 [Ignavibacteriaceae bacterium]